MRSDTNVDCALLERSISRLARGDREHPRGVPGALPRQIEQTSRECPRGVPGALPRQIEQTQARITIERRCKEYDSHTHRMSDISCKSDNRERQEEQEREQSQVHRLCSFRSRSLHTRQSDNRSDQLLRTQCYLRQEKAGRVATERCSHVCSHVCAHSHCSAILLSVDRPLPRVR